MIMKTAIGIDPDALGCEAVLVNSSCEIVKVRKSFDFSTSGLNKAIRWFQSHPGAIICIEGLNGQSKPLEDRLQKEGMIFYSFKSSDVEYFRHPVMGENKNNEIDAEATARFGLALYGQNKLEMYRRVFLPDNSLRSLTRELERITRKKTEEVSTIWKAIKAISQDLYLALSGNHKEIAISGNIVQNKCILKLFTAIPDVKQWKSMTTQEFINAMGDPTHSGRDNLIAALKKVSALCLSSSEGEVVVIKNCARRLLLLKELKDDVISAMKRITESNTAVQKLIEFKGIAVSTAATIIAEMIDIRRFMNDDRLASYAGLGMKEKSTGRKTNKKMVRTKHCNHRLKNAFMTAAGNFVLYNKDSHLTGYFKNLRKAGMSAMEARKRVARALVRRFHKILREIVLSTNEVEIKQDRESMANGHQSRSGKIHSNMSLPASSDYTPITTEDVNEKKERILMKCT
jgi:transposase